MAEINTAKETTADARARLLSLLAERKAREATDAQSAGITRLRSTEPARLSAAQEGLWFIEELLGPSALYNIVRATRLEGPLDVKALTSSLRHVVARHDSLRSRVVAADPHPLMEVLPAVVVELPLVDIGPMDEPELTQELVAQASQPLDLSRGTPWSFKLLRRSPTSHVLLIVVHHLFGDGWSMGVMARELAELYRQHTQARQDGPAALEPLKLQFADCAAWLRQRQKDGQLADELRFWSRQLAELSPLELPTDRARPARLSHRGAWLGFQLSPQTRARIQALCTEKSCTPYAVLLTVFKVLLKRLASQDDIAVGTPVAARSRPEFEDQIGYFVNAVVLRSDLSGNPRFEEALKRVQHTTLDAFDHQELPFDQLVAHLSPERDLSRNPLFQVSFSLQSYPADTVLLEGLSSQRMTVPTACAKFDLSLEFIEDKGRLCGSFDFNTDLFDVATIRRWQGHYLTLLDAVLEDPSITINRAPLLTPLQRQQLLTGWNNTAAPRDDSLTLHGLFEAAARKHPAALAAREGAAGLSYAELDAQATTLAHRLRALGVGPDQKVAVSMGRSLDLLVALFGVLKAGGAYVPLDPQYPNERLEFMLADSGSVLVITDAASKARLPKTELPWVQLPLTPDDGSANQAVAAKPPPAVAGDSLAYVIYTSGSTGQPKGVEVPHRGICNHVQWMVDALAIGSGDVFLQKTSISFDASLVEIFVPLAVGAKTVLAQGDGERDTRYLADMLHQHGVTVLQVVPSALSALLQEPVLAQCKALRRVICGGETLDRQLAREVQQLLPHARLGNFYGPTEASIDATWHEVNELAPGAGPVPIGRPVANARCHVLDPDLQPVPVGVVGELFVGGRGLARGYLGRPELNAERFIDDPFVSGERLYRTGDRVRYLADGELECLGRADDQVKLRGFRIELGEIEAAVQALPGVGACAVLLREDRPGVKQLVAYVESETSLATAVMSGLRARLPSHMVPSHVMAIPQLPRLPNGKLNRKALPTPASHRLIEAAIAPRTPMEGVLASIWSEVLALDELGVHDNFFDLGGHSLVATRIAARVRGKLQLDMPLHWLFEAPTVAELALRLQGLRATGGEASSSLPQMQAPQRLQRREGPASFAQRQMWLLQQRHPSSVAYNMGLAYRLHGALDTEKFAAALHDVLASHEAFRTRFVLADDEPKQMVDETLAAELSLLDWTSDRAENRQALLEELVESLRQRPFDLAKASLCRAALVRLDEAEHAVLLVLHHAVADHWSLGILLRQLAQRYAMRIDGQTPLLKPAALDYVDYASWSRQRLNAEALDRLWTYWKTKLAGLRPLPLPYDRAPPLERKGEGGRVLRSLSVGTVKRLRAFSQERGLTPTMCLMTVLGIQLRALTGQDDIVIGTPVATRPRAEFESMVGVFLNTVLLRFDIAGNRTFAESVEHVRDVSLAAYMHQDMPYDELHIRLRQKGFSQWQDLQVLFTVLTAPAEHLVLEGVRCEPVESPSHAAQLDLSLIVELDGVPQVTLTYAQDVFDEKTAQRWLAAYLELLDTLLAEPKHCVAEVDVCSREERLELARWNDTSVAFDEQACVFTLIARQAAKTPLAVAVSETDRQLSYAELAARSNRLARALRAGGVGRGGLVGLCVNRSLDMVVAQLAILKSGAAYVPLDPAYPADRLAYMDEDAQLAMLVTESALAPVMNWPRDRSLWIDADEPSISAHASEPLPADKLLDARPEDPAYVIYTSGSTGKPKGVAVPHKAVVNFLESMAREPGLAESDRLAAVTTLSFDIHVLELLLPLAVGAQIILVPRQLATDGKDLAELLASSGATVMQATPSTWRLLVESGWKGRSDFKALIGGEPLPRDLAEALLQRTGTLWNMYGPTETTVWSTSWQVRAIEGGISVGKPIANTQIHILDERLKSRPVGAAGEICIGGEGVTLGYLKRPELTAEKFIARDGLDARAGRVYRTGDLGRWRSDGTLEHLGRMDSQVKVRGYRIELGEIESALSTFPHVSHAVVTTCEAAPGDVRLVAYLVGVQVAPSLAQVRAHLAQSLPEHMLPHHVMAVESIPLLPNGKVDRKALPFPTWAQEKPTADVDVAALSEEEQSMALIWQQVLGLPTLPDVTQSFHDLGGHSLLAARLGRAVEQSLGRPCSLQQLYRAPTIRTLCGELSKAPAEVAAEIIPLTLNTDKPALFCICGVYLYKHLADQLAADYSTFGIFLPYEKKLLSAATPESVAWPSIEEMAADYVEAILARQAQGPYRVAGVSFGGVVAFEVAQQLWRAGHQVAFVGLLDSMLSQAIRRDFLSSSLSAGWNSIKRACQKLLQRPGAAGEEPADAPASDGMLVIRRQEIYLRAIAAYRPQPYPGTVVLARAVDHPLRFGEQIDPHYGWLPYVVDLKRVDVSGDHLGHLKPPHVSQLCAGLLPYLKPPS